MGGHPHTSRHPQLSESHPITTTKWSPSPHGPLNNHMDGGLAPTIHVYHAMVMPKYLPPSHHQYPDLSSRKSSRQSTINTPSLSNFKPHGKLVLWHKGGKYVQNPNCLRERTAVHGHHLCLSSHTDNNGHGRLSLHCSW